MCGLINQAEVHLCGNWRHLVHRLRFARRVLVLASLADYAWQSLLRVAVVGQSSVVAHLSCQGTEKRICNLDHIL